MENKVSEMGESRFTSVKGCKPAFLFHRKFLRNISRSPKIFHETVVPNRPFWYDKKQ